MNVDKSILYKEIPDPKPTFEVCKVCELNKVDYWVHIKSIAHY